MCDIKRLFILFTHILLWSGGTGYKRRKSSLLSPNILGHDEDLFNSGKIRAKRYNKGKSSFKTNYPSSKIFAENSYSSNEFMEYTTEEDGLSGAKEMFTYPQSKFPTHPFKKSNKERKYIKGGKESHQESSFTESAFLGNEFTDLSSGAGISYGEQEHMTTHYKRVSPQGKINSKVAKKSWIKPVERGSGEEHGKFDVEARLGGIHYKSTSSGDPAVRSSWKYGNNTHREIHKTISEGESNKLGKPHAVKNKQYGKLSSVLNSKHQSGQTKQFSTSSGKVSGWDFDDMASVDEVMSRTEMNSTSGNKTWSSHSNETFSPNSGSIVYHKVIRHNPDSGFITQEWKSESFGNAIGGHEDIFGDIERVFEEAYGRGEVTEQNARVSHSSWKVDASSDISTVENGWSRTSFHYSSDLGSIDEALLGGLDQSGRSKSSMLNNKLETGSINQKSYQQRSKSRNSLFNQDYEEATTNSPWSEPGTMSYYDLGKSNHHGSLNSTTSFRTVGYKSNHNSHSKKRSKSRHTLFNQHYRENITDTPFNEETMSDFYNSDNSKSHYGFNSTSSFYKVGSKGRHGSHSKHTSNKVHSYLSKDNEETTTYSPIHELKTMYYHYSGKSDNDNSYRTSLHIDHSKIKQKNHSKHRNDTRNQDFKVAVTNSPWTEPTTTNDFYNSGNSHNIDSFNYKTLQRRGSNKRYGGHIKQTSKSGSSYNQEYEETTTYPPWNEPTLSNFYYSGNSNNNNFNATTSFKIHDSKRRHGGHFKHRSQSGSSFNRGYQETTTYSPRFEPTIISNLYYSGNFSNHGNFNSTTNLRRYGFKRRHGGNFKHRSQSRSSYTHDYQETTTYSPWNEPTIISNFYYLGNSSNPGNLNSTTSFSSKRRHEGHFEQRSQSGSSLNQDDEDITTYPTWNEPTTTLYNSGNSNNHGSFRFNSTSSLKRNGSKSEHSKHKNKSRKFFQYYEETTTSSPWLNYPTTMHNGNYNIYFNFTSNFEGKKMGNGNHLKEIIKTRKSHFNQGKQKTSQSTPQMPNEQKNMTAHIHIDKSYSGGQENQSRMDTEIYEQTYHQARSEGVDGLLMFDNEYESKIKQKPSLISTHLEGDEWGDILNAEDISEDFLQTLVKKDTQNVEYLEHWDMDTAMSSHSFDLMRETDTDVTTFYGNYTGSEDEDHYNKIIFDKLSPKKPDPIEIHFEPESDVWSDLTPDVLNQDHSKTILENEKSKYHIGSVHRKKTDHEYGVNDNLYNQLYQNSDQGIQEIMKEKKYFKVERDLKGIKNKNEQGFVRHKGHSERSHFQNKDNLNETEYFQNKESYNYKSHGATGIEIQDDILSNSPLNPIVKASPIFHKESKEDLGNIKYVQEIMNNRDVLTIERDHQIVRNNNGEELVRSRGQTDGSNFQNKDSFDGTEYFQTKEHSNSNSFNQNQIEIQDESMPELYQKPRFKTSPIYPRESKDNFNENFGNIPGKQKSEFRPDVIKIDYQQLELLENQSSGIGQFTQTSQGKLLYTKMSHALSKLFHGSDIVHVIIVSLIKIVESVMIVNTQIEHTQPQITWSSEECRDRCFSRVCNISFHLCLITIKNYFNRTRSEKSIVPTHGIIEDQLTLSANLKMKDFS